MQSQRRSTRGRSRSTPPIARAARRRWCATSSWCSAARRTTTRSAAPRGRHGRTANSAARWPIGGPSISKETGRGSRSSPPGRSPCPRGMGTPSSGCTQKPYGCLVGSMPRRSTATTSLRSTSAQSSSRRCCSRPGAGGRRRARCTRPPPTMRARCGSSVARRGLRRAPSTTTGTASASSTSATCGASGADPTPRRARARRRSAGARRRSAGSTRRRATRRAAPHTVTFSILPLSPRATPHQGDDWNSANDTHIWLKLDAFQLEDQARVARGEEPNAVPVRALCTHSGQCRLHA